MKLSVVIITKNESDVIASCIESVKKLADEVIVLDAHSLDDTVKVAKEKGAKVFTHKFKDFADQREKAASHATGDWILYLDADEVATTEFVSEVAKTLEEPTKNGYFIRRKTYYFGKDWGHTDRVQRLLKKHALKGWRGTVHETPEIDGDFGIINSPVHHFTHRNFSQMVEKTNEWSEYEANLRLKAHHPKMTPWRFCRVMLTAFFSSYVKDGGYKNGMAGIIEAIYQSFSMFITYAKLWEMQERK